MNIPKGHGDYSVNLTIGQMHAFLEEDGHKFATNDGHIHHNDSLYPRNIYRCTECGKEHGTRAYNGAVNWQCPNELFSGLPESHAPTRQEYVGFLCVFCNEMVRETTEQGIERLRAERAARQFA